jgi:uncharacterized protein YpmB
VGPVDLAALPAGVRAAVARAGTNGAARTEAIKWLGVQKLRERAGRPETRDLYQLYGRDAKGNRCEVLVDAQWGVVIGKKCRLGLAEARATLPEVVSQALEKHQADNSAFKPTEVEVIYTGDKVAYYAFESKGAAGKKDAVLIRAADGKIEPKANSQ